MENNQHSMGLEFKINVKQFFPMLMLFAVMEKYNNLLKCIKIQNLLQTIENITFFSIFKCLNNLMQIRK